MTHKQGSESSAKCFLLRRISRFQTSLRLEWIHIMHCMFERLPCMSPMVRSRSRFGEFIYFAPWHSTPWFETISLSKAYTLSNPADTPSAPLLPRAARPTPSSHREIPYGERRHPATSCCSRICRSSWHGSNIDKQRVSKCLRKGRMRGSRATPIPMGRLAFGVPS